MPERVQRQRTKGWRMPENTVYVGRGSKWGNPYRVGYLSGSPYSNHQFIPKNNQEAVDYYRNWVIGYVSDGGGVKLIPFAGAHRIDELRGKNLACWCRLDQPCHADILLEIANKEGE